MIPTPARARLVLGSLVVVAVAEIGASFFAYRKTIESEDFESIAEVIEADAEVALGAEWLGPRARMALPQLREVGRPDLLGIGELWVVDTAAGRGWSAALEAELAGEPGFERVEKTRFGGLSLHHLRRTTSTRQLADFTARSPEVAVEGPERAGCRQNGDTWRCKDIATVERRMAEIEHRPRRCLVVDLDERHLLRLRWDGAELGTVLRGHVGFDDFNARLRSDAPAELTVRIDDEVQMQSIFTDDQGWAAFAVETEPGTHRIEVEVRVGARGTWQREGYQANAAHAVCLELRSFAEEMP